VYVNTFHKLVMGHWDQAPLLAWDEAINIQTSGSPAGCQLGINVALFVSFLCHKTNIYCKSATLKGLENCCEDDAKLYLMPFGNI